jgi:hypothetical protein
MSKEAAYKHTASFILCGQVNLCRGDKFLLRDFNVGSLQKVHGVFVDAIGDTIHNAANACVDEHFCAIDAREMGHVTGRAFGRNPV